jgi:hypothetical protein
MRSIGNASEEGAGRRPSPCRARGAPPSAFPLFLRSNQHEKYRKKYKR